MEPAIQSLLDTLRSSDGNARYAALIHILAITEQPVGWAYAVWDELVAALRDKDNHQRAIAAQLLCNLARSDPDNRMRADFPALLAVTKDARFVTARHCMQALWKVGRAGAAQQAMVVASLAGRFSECSTEKNCTLIRYDILQGLRKLYDEVRDDGIRQQALALIATEEDAKYRKKYSTLWR